MKAERLRKLQRQLHSRLPLIGGWRRRRAFRALAQDGSPEAIRALAEAVARTDDQELAFDIATQVLWKLVDQPAIDAVCGVWAKTRHGALAVLLGRQEWVASAPVEVKVLSALKVGRTEQVQDGSPDVAAPLVHACEDPDPLIAERARSMLPALTKPRTRQAVADLVCARWLEARSPLLEEIVVRGRYVAEEPLLVRVWSALKTGQRETIAALGAEVVTPLLQACEDADATIAEQARLALRQLQSVDAREQVCRWVVENDHPAARDAAIQGGYLPRDEHQGALFLFLTEQWERYEALDFDRRLLRSAYGSADAALRQRLMEKLRAAGRVDFLTVLAGGDYRSRVAVMTSSETEFLVHMLAEKGEWEKLWALAFEVPAAWSLGIVRILAGNGWQPEAGDGRDMLRELVRLASGDMVLSGEEISRHLAPAVQRARIRITGGRINDLAFSPIQPVIALGASQREIVIWNFERAAREWVAGGFAHSIGLVTFTHRDGLVCAERTNDVDAKCSVYGRDDGKMIRLGQHTGSVTALEPVRESQVLTAGRDQKVTLLDVDAGRTLREKRFDFWARSACVAPGEQSAVLLHKGATLVDLPQLDELASTPEWGWHGMSRRAAFSPHGEEIILGKFKREVIVLSRVGGSLRAQTHPLATHHGTIQALGVLPSRSVVVTASSDGEVRLTAWTSRTFVGSVRIPGPQLTSLHVSPDESFMAIGDSDGSMSLWDLRALDVPMLFTIPLARAMPNHLAAVQVVADGAGVPAPVRRALEFLKCILQYRFRYDIEIGEVPTIKVGEFDIEIG